MRILLPKFALGTMEDPSEVLVRLAELGIEGAAAAGGVLPSAFGHLTFPLVSTVEWEDGTSGKTEKCQVLQVETVDGQGKLLDTVEKCFAGFFVKEELGGDNRYRTDAGVLVEATKHLRIGEAPKVLSVYLKRFRGQGMGWEKAGHHVQFAEGINLRLFMQEPSHAFYRLCAVIVHDGETLERGHYYAYVRRETTWYMASDKIIMEVSVAEVKKAVAVMLFFERYVPKRLPT